MQSKRSQKLPELRMVLVGKAGAGKSAAGNTLLGKKVFRSALSYTGVTKECQKEKEEFEGQIVSVVDTPPLFDINMTEYEAKNEIVNCVSLAAPGPHVFLVVIQPNRFTEDEQQTVKLIQQVFGEKSSAYAMVLLTHGDELEFEEVNIESFINGNPNLRKFIHQCHGGYHVLNNRKKDPEQVRELLMKINLMVGRNGGSHYADMLRKAEKAIRVGKLSRENLESKKENGFCTFL